MRPKVLVGAVAVAGSLLVAMLAPSPGRDVDATQVVAVHTADVVAPAGGTASIPALVDRARQVDDARSHAQLGLAYLRRARDEADPAALTLAERSLRRSLERGDTLEAFVGMASLANARHDFSGSVRWSRRAIEANPHSAAAYGLLGDALFELGRVDAADDAYQRMVDMRPDVASYVRASYALQHRGRTSAAIGAMRLALQAAGPSGETAAWVRHQMGDIYAARGDTAGAARENRIGSAIAPGYAPPRVGLAEAYVARGRLRAAVGLMEGAVTALPSLEYSITLGDLYRATGRDERAEARYEDVVARLRDYRRNGVLPDADFVVFYADHGLRLRAALREGGAIYRNRPTPKVADAYAWILHAAGRDHAAWRRARVALAAPAPAPEAMFHAAVIARSLRRDVAATRLARRALDAHPSLSVVHLPRARRLAKG